MSFLDDLRSACRRLWRSRATAGVAVASLAIGIGADTLLFSVASGVLDRQLPVRSPHELARVFSTEGGSGYLNVTLGERDAVAGLDDIFSGVAAHAMLPVSVSVDGEPEQTTGELVSANYFDVLGLAPGSGRFFTERDRAREEWPHVAVVRDAYARRRWPGGTAIGSEIIVNGAPLTVIGVAPEQFSGTFFGLDLDLWVPTALRGITPWPPSEARRYELTARLRPSFTHGRAAIRVRALGRDLAEGAPASERSRGLVLTEAAGVRPGPRAPIQTFLALLGALTSLVLVVGGLNLSGLLAVRALECRRELAIRAALGATPRRLVALLLSESAALGLAGAVCAALLVRWSSQTLSALPIHAGLPVRFDLAPDARVYVFAAVLGILSGGAFGILPAWRASRRDVVSGLRSQMAGGGRGPRQAVVVAQLAISTALVVAAGLLARSAAHVHRGSDPGFDWESVVVATAEPALLGYRDEAAVRFLDDWRRNAMAHPAVATAALARYVPLSSQSDQLAVELESASGQPVRSERTYYNVVSPGYFATLGIPVVRGRGFAGRDAATGAGVVIANDAFVRRHWPGADPLGRWLRLPEAPGPRTVEVIGVVATTTYRQIGEAPRPYLYFPTSQWPLREATLYARTRGDRAGAARALVEALRRLEPDLAAADVGPLAERMAFVTVPQRVAGFTVGGAAMLAVLLAAAGLYGVVAHTTRLRSHELAVRRCVGATSSDVLRSVLSGCARLAALSLVPGALAAWGLGHVLSGLLVGVTPSDPPAYAGAAALTALVAVAAAWGPGRRASRGDPSAVLRSE